MCDRCFHRIWWGQTFGEKKAKTVLNGFIKIVNESNHKPNTLWVNQGK